MEVFAPIVFAAGCLNHLKKQEILRASAEFDHENAPLRSILSMLIDGVYLRDRYYVGDVTAKLIGGQNGREQHYCNVHWDRMSVSERVAEEEKSLGLAHFLRQDRCPNKNAPELVIALRGTILYNYKDLWSNLRTSLEILDKGSRVARCKMLIYDLITKFRKEYGREARICLTGHSLGAAIALLVGRDLESTNLGHLVETHVFNPPFVTVLSVLRGFIPDVVADSAKILRIGVWGEDLTMKTVVQRLGNPALIKREHAEFQRLASWVPYFYLNSNDPICNRFIKYYKKRHGQAGGPDFSVQGVMTRLIGRNAKYINVVPSAHLVISRRFDSDVIKAHTISQWYVDVVKSRLEEFPARLLAKAQELGRGTRALTHPSRPAGTSTSHKDDAFFSEVRAILSSN